jgi:hypothetical protein
MAAVAPQPAPPTTAAHAVIDRASAAPAWRRVRPAGHQNIGHQGVIVAATNGPTAASESPTAPGRHPPARPRCWSAYHDGVDRRVRAGAGQ